MAPAATAKPVESKPATDQFDYLKKYLDKPATAKSIVTKPAAQPIPGKAANPQPANAIVPKSTTRRTNPAPSPKPTVPTPKAAIKPQPVAIKRPPVAPQKVEPKQKIEPKQKVEPKKADNDQFLLNQLELPKDVRSLVDRLPMPKDKPEELIPIGKLLGK
jgi:hypothetical protein